MKWRKQKPPLPGIGETRIRRVFAWRRTEVGDYIVWLESYEVHERYFVPASGWPGWWCEYSRNRLELAY